MQLADIIHKTILKCSNVSAIFLARQKLLPSIEQIFNCYDIVVRMSEHVDKMSKNSSTPPPNTYGARKSQRIIFSVVQIVS